MKNLVQPESDRMTLTAPIGGVTSGEAYKIGHFFGIAISTVAAGLKFVLQVMGIVTLTKTTGEAWTEGLPIFWDTITGKATSSSATGGSFIGFATAAAGSSATTGNVNLVPAVGAGEAGQVLTTFTAPTGGVTAGTCLLIGDVLVYPLETALATETFAAQIEGIVSHAKAAVAWSEGEELFWDDANKVITNDPTANYPVGTAAASAGSGDSTGLINLLGKVQGEQTGIYSLVAPAGVTRGTPVLINSTLVMPLETKLVSETFRGKIGGPADVPILGTDTPTMLADLYWDDGNTRFTTTASTHKLLAVALVAKPGSETTIRALLFGHSGTFTN